MENEVHCTMAVMDAEMGKLLDYKQSLKHPKDKGKWQILSANEFSRLAQGVGGRIKGTNTITFIRMKDIPKECMKDVTRSVCLYGLSRKSRAESNTLCRW